MKGFAAAEASYEAQETPEYYEDERDEEAEAERMIEQYELEEMWR